MFPCLLHYTVDDNEKPRLKFRAQLSLLVVHSTFHSFRCRTGNVSMKRVGDIAKDLALTELGGLQRIRMGLKRAVRKGVLRNSRRNEFPYLLVPKLKMEQTAHPLLWSLHHFDLGKAALIDAFAEGQWK